MTNGNNFKCTMIAGHPGLFMNKPSFLVPRVNFILISDIMVNCYDSSSKLLASTSAMNINKIELMNYNKDSNSIILFIHTKK